MDTTSCSVARGIMGCEWLHGGAIERALSPARDAAAGLGGPLAGARGTAGLGAVVFTVASCSIQPVGFSETWGKCVWGVERSLGGPPPLPN